MSYIEKVEQILCNHIEEAIDKLYERNLFMNRDYYIQGIYLQGSQNYNTHHNDSDVDSKLVVVPSVSSLLMGKNLNHELVLENNEHVAVKTVQDYTDLFFKGNINNMEILTTQYCIEEDDSFFGNLRANNTVETIVKLVQGTLWDASLGMMIQKEKSLFKGTVTTQPFVDKYGYDSKDIIHIIRIHDMLSRLANGESFVSSLDFSKSEDYTKVKKLRSGYFFDDEVKVIASDYIQRAKQMKELFDPKNSEKAQMFREQLKQEFVKNYERKYP